MKCNVNIDKLSIVKRQMDDEINKLDNLLRNCIEKIDETVEVFDTPTSKVFREQAKDLVNLGKEYVNETVKPFIANLDNYIAIYRNSNDEIKRIVTNKRE